VTPDELRAAIQQAAQESASRSGSAYVDERQRLIQQWADQLAALAYPFAEEAMSEDEATALAALQPEIDALAADLAETIGLGMIRISGLVRGRPERKALTGITITNKPTASVLVGTTWALSYTPEFTGPAASLDPVVVPVWTSSDETKATVDATTGVVTAVATGGTPTITVAAGGHSDTYVFPVANTPSAPNSVVVSYGSTTSPVTVPDANPDITLTYMVKDQFGADMALETATWDSSNDAFATISAGGVVNFIAAGTVNFTATSDTDPTKVGTFQFIITAEVLTPTTVEIAGASTRSTTVGASGTLTAIVKDQNGTTMPGLSATWASDNADVSINAGTGAWTAAGEGGAIVTASYTGAASDTVTFTVGPAAGAGFAESPTGRRPEFCWSGEQQDVWNTWIADYEAAPASSDPHIQILAEMIRDANATNFKFCVNLYQMTGLQSWANIAIPAVTADLINVYNAHVAAGKNGVDADAMREHFFHYIVMFDWLYPAMTSTQRADMWTALELWTASALGELTINTNYQSGGLNDDDQAVGIYIALSAIHFLNVPENTRYRNVLNGSRRYSTSGYVSLGGEAAALTTVTGESHSNHREFMNEIFGRATAGGHSHVGIEYAAGTFHLQIIGCLGIRQASTNGSNRVGVDVSTYLPEFDATFDEAVERMHSIIYPDNSTVTFWGDMESGRGAFKHYRFMECMAALTGLAWQRGTSGADRAQRMMNDYTAAHVAQIKGQPYIARMFWFWNPYAPATVGALPEATTPEAWYIGRDAAPSMQYWGPGHKYIRFAGATSPYHIAFFGANEHLTDHAWAQWGDFEIWRDGEILIRHMIAYSNPLLNRPASHNVMALAGLPAMQYNVYNEPFQEGWGVIDEASGTAGGVSWETLATETHGRYVPQPYSNPPSSFVDEAKRLFAFLHRPATDVDCLVLQSRGTTYDLVGNQAMTNPGFARHTDNISVTNTLAGTYYNAHVLKTLGIGLVWDLTGKTITAGKWGTAMLSIAADGTTTQTTWAATVNFDTQALAEAEMPAVPANHTALGWVSIKAGSGANWVGGTSALQSGGGTSPASITSYKNGNSTVWAGNTYLLSRYTAADQARILAAKTLTGSGGLPNGSEKLLHLHIPTTATLTAGPPAYHGWQTAGGQDVRVYHLAPTASTTPAGALSHSTVSAASVSPEASTPETTGLNVLRSWNTTRQDTDKFVTVILMGVAANFPAVALSANNPDIVLIGSGGTQRTVTFSTGLAVVT
jgi:uncharacterized protein YjdB